MKPQTVVDGVLEIVRSATQPLHERIRSLEADVAALKKQNADDLRAAAVSIRQRGRQP